MHDLCCTKEQMLFSLWSSLWAYGLGMKKIKQRKGGASNFLYKFMEPSLGKSVACKIFGASVLPKCTSWIVIPLFNVRRNYFKVTISPVWRETCQPVYCGTFIISGNKKYTWTSDCINKRLLLKYVV